MALSRPPLPLLAVLLDIGGVVVDVDFDRAYLRWAELSNRPAELIRDRFRADTGFIEYECGRVSTEDYFAHLSAVLDIGLDGQKVMEGWLAIVGDLTPNVTLRLQLLATMLPLYSLSNSNPIHHRACIARFPQVFALFRHSFLSFETGMRKPDPAAFHATVQQLGVVPGRVLYMDNSLENVRAGEAVGLLGVHTPSADVFREELDRILSARNAW